VENPREEKCYDCFKDIKNMYQGASASVRTHDEVTDNFSITIGLLQGSTLSAYILI
jgi:hypothetical protein